MNKIELLRHEDASYVLMYGTDVDLISEYVMEMTGNQGYDSWLSYAFEERELFDVTLDAVIREYPAAKYELN